VETVHQYRFMREALIASATVARGTRDAGISITRMGEIGSVLPHFRQLR